MRSLDFVSKQPLPDHFVRSLSRSLIFLAVITVAIKLRYGAREPELRPVYTEDVPILPSLSNLLASNRNDANANHRSPVGLRGYNHSTIDIAGWHPRMVEYGDLTRIAILQRGRLEVVHHPDFGARPVLVKMAGLPGDIKSISHETIVYRLLYGLQITPLFLGHVTEYGRIIGLITEYVQQPEKRPAQHSRAEACLSALRQMHKRGIAHGDAHAGNCLAREDGSAALIDFELAMETTSRVEFERDLWIMSHTGDIETWPLI